MSTELLDSMKQQAENLNVDEQLDFLSGYVGTVNGSTEALSENSGERFTQELLRK